MHARTLADVGRVTDLLPAMAAAALAAVTPADARAAAARLDDAEVVAL